MTHDPHGAKAPRTSVPIADVLAQRWSPRGFDADADITADQLTALIEAARWTASSANSQPWRFIVTRRGTPDFDRVFGCLTGGNLAWAHRAGALVVMVARVRTDDGTPMPWAEYDTGHASGSLTVQAESMGLTAHQMGGFDRQQLSTEFGLADDLRPMAVIAVGTFDPDAELPEPFASRETAPRQRLDVADLLLNEWPD